MRTKDIYKIRRQKLPVNAGKKLSTVLRKLLLIPIGYYNIFIIFPIPG